MPSWCNEDGEPYGDWQAALTPSDPDPYDDDDWSIDYDFDYEDE